MCEHDSECIGDTAFGRTITVIRMVMSLAEDGGMTIARSDAVAKEIIEAIENTNGQLCECGDCTNRMDLETACEGWLDGVMSIYSAVPHHTDILHFLARVLATNHCHFPIIWPRLHWKQRP